MNFVLIMNHSFQTKIIKTELPAGH